MDDALVPDRLATVIPFPRHRVRGPEPLPGPAPDSPSARPEEYWALVQSLAAERRALGGGVG